MEGQLQTAMKAVGQAIQLDGDGENREAYFRYLACIQFISQGILQDSKNQGYQAPIKSNSTVKMLKLAQQCLDRATAIMESAEERESAHLVPPPPSDQSGRFSPSIQSIQSFSSLPNPAEHPQLGPGVRSVPPRHAQQTPRANQGAAASTTSLAVPAGYKRPAAARKDKLTPLEAAYLENQRLMSSYRARLVKLTKTSKGKGQLNKTTLNLTLQRRLMENMAIARAREAALAKKIQERHQRLQEEAVSRFSTTGEPTRGEIELRMIYASVMEFENNEDWLSEWRRKLRESPKDLQFIHALLGHILACSDHPFTQLLQKFQYSIYQSLLPLVKKDAEELEQIKVPYKTVEPLLLSDSRTRVIPPDGFATPEDLAEENLDEDLLRRLQALRNSSSDERKESLYGDMLASPSSLGEDEEGDMWDSGDDTLEGGVGLEGEQAVDGGGVSANSESAPLKSRVSVEVELYEDSEHRQSDSQDDEGRNTDECRGNLSGMPKLPIGESGDHRDDEKENGACTEENAEVHIRDPDENIEEDSREEDDVIRQMKRISTEAREDLREALVEGEEQEKQLERQIEEDLADVRTEQNGEAHKDTEPEHIPTDDSEDEETGDERGDNVKTESERQVGEDERLDNERRTKEVEEQEQIARLQEEALQRHLKHISKDIQAYLDRLQSLLVAIYEDLDSAVAKEQCIAIIEKHFFRLIWQPLLTLFRRANLRKEMSAATAMTKYQNALPENIGILKKLCLSSEEGDSGAQDNSHYPYQLAVEELRRISGYFSPLEKLECVVKASRAIISCVGDYYEAQGGSRENTENAVGCDDLLPILSFVVIKSALPHIVSECSIMEEFIHEGYLFGEEGYCLTTLQTSLGYVLKLAED